ncbi:STAS domain-containing protein [Hymenobacter norwichensis]|uniref:STAS domain-containing protein n=1 Tax=Hymenobacter norwichensis TaxID=223903 RepID=UPI0003B46CE2
MHVYREILPESYLLILTGSHFTDAHTLQRALHRAGGSGKANIWIDCSEMSHPTTAVVELLGQFCKQVRSRGIELILCHLEEECQHAVQQLPTAAQPLVLATLLDASLYCRNLHFSTLPSVA